MDEGYSEISRRKFLKATALGAMGPTSLMIVKPEAVRGSAANSAISVGVIGPGRRGSYDAGLMTKIPGVRIVALCDVYDDQIEAAKEKIPVESPSVYKDYQKLLNTDVDVVLLATPPYQHPEQFEAAVSARKHIYFEKPVAVDPAGCRRVVAAARRADPSKDVVVGFQQRFGPGYLEAYRVVHASEIGPIRLVRASWLGGDLPRRHGPFSPEEEKIRNWLFYREHSGDIIVEQQCHNFDVVNWFLGAHPLRAEGHGGRLVRTDIGNVMDHDCLTYEYPGHILLSYAANQFCKKGFTRVGEEFLGTNGAVATSRRSVTVYNPTGEPSTIEAKRDITIDTVEQFFDRIQSGKVQNMAEAAAQSTLTAILGRTAIDEGREVKWEEVASA